MTAQGTRPTVAFVTHSAQLSGAELFLCRVTSATRRIRPLVVLGEHGPLESALAAADVDVLVLPLSDRVRAHTGATAGGLRALTGAVDTARAAARLARVLRRRGVRVVTTHSAKAHLYAGLAGRLSGVPVVVHLHGVLGAGGARRWNVLLLRGAVRAFASAVIANSRTTAESAAVPSRTPLDVIGCPVVLPDSVVAPPDGPVFVVVGRLSAQKGQDVAIRAFATALERGMPRSATLRIVGAALFEQDHAFAATLAGLADALGVADRVEFVGHTDDVRAELDRADVAVHASPSAEGFGQVVAEAMAAGRPVIASAAGGPAEIVSDQVDGVLVAPGDVAELAEAMTRLASDPALRARLAGAGREAVLRFALPTVVAQLESALTDRVR